MTSQGVPSLQGLHWIISRLIKLFPLDTNSPEIKVTVVSREMGEMCQKPGGAQGSVEKVQRTDMSSDPTVSSFHFPKHSGFL